MKNLQLKFIEETVIFKSVCSFLVSLIRFEANFVEHLWPVFAKKSGFGLKKIIFSINLLFFKVL